MLFKNVFDYLSKNKFKIFINIFNITVPTLYFIHNFEFKSSIFQIPINKRYFLH